MSESFSQATDVQAPRERREKLDGERFSILSGMADINLQILNRASHVMHVSDGVEIVHEGDPPHDLYFVLEGRLAVSKRFGGEAHVLGYLQAGMSTGNSA